jgi:hypothetical protein
MIYEYISIHEIKGKLQVVVNQICEDKNWSFSEYVSWVKSHIIIDFVSIEDEKKCRAYAIRKHYNSNNSFVSHDIALKDGIEVDCIKFKRGSTLNIKWASQNEAERSLNKQFAYFETPNKK